MLMEENGRMGATGSAAESLAETGMDRMMGGVVPATAEDAEKEEREETEGFPEDGEPIGESEDRTETVREEFERLIKGRFKELYAEETQRMINRRFRKYKVLEERCKTLQEVLEEKETALNAAAQKLSEFDERLREELDRVARETEENVRREIRSRRARPAENAVLPGAGRGSLDVSKLTKTEREKLARRAAGGERIKL